MLFSFNELKRLSGAPQNWRVEDMVEVLNKLGFEVERFTQFVDAEGAKFGQITKVSQHPNADKLFVCEVQLADKKSTILTNATNATEGKYAVVFVPGSRIGDIVFATKELKGVISEGMFSALEELGVNKDLIPEELKQGIWILDKADLAANPLEVLGLDDFIIEIDLLSNRSDAQSYWVLAKEIAAWLGQDIKIFEDHKRPITKSTLKVSDGEANLLSLAEAKVDKLKTSYADQLLLIKGGIKCSTPIVDLTNLALIMTGQPVHAYDANRVGKTFTAAIGTSKETILGNVEVEFEDALLIKDDKKFVSAAGAMGFENTRVTSSTSDVVVEVGNFNIKQVRKTAKQTRIDSLAARQSSKILAKGTQKLAWAYISNRLEISEVIGMQEIKQKKVSFLKTKLEDVIGHKLKEDIYQEVISKMHILGFELVNNEFIVPEYRHDVESQQDLNEEFLRLYGYDNFELVAPSVKPSQTKEIKHKHKELAAMGYQEVWTYSLISKEKNIVNPFQFKKTIELQTFVSKEREVIRNSMAQSLLEVVEYNKRRKVEDISIFDIGQINDGILVASLASTTKDFTQIQQDVLNLIKQEVLFERIEDSSLHPGVTAKIILNNKMIGWIGKLHPSVNSTNAFVAEIKLEQISKSITFNKYDEQQMKKRDITIELESKEEISSKIKDLELFSIKVIDTYINDKVRKVTLRAIGTEKQINKLDGIFNK